MAAHVALAQVAAPGNGTAVDKPKERHFGVSGSIGPLSLGVMTDVESRGAYGFARGGLGIAPQLWDPPIWFGGISFGVGGTLRLHRGWQLDLFADGILLWLRHDERDDKRLEFNSAVGVGAGLHYTSTKGFTLGFKLPILGVGFTPGHSSDGWRGLLFDHYFVAAAGGLCSVSVGYRL